MDALSRLALHNGTAVVEAGGVRIALEALARPQLRTETWERAVWLLSIVASQGHPKARELLCQQAHLPLCGCLRFL